MGKTPKCRFSPPILSLFSLFLMKGRGKREREEREKEGKREREKERKRGKRGKREREKERKRGKTEREKERKRAREEERKRESRKGGERKGGERALSPSPSRSSLASRNDPKTKKKTKNTHIGVEPPHARRQVGLRDIPRLPGVLVLVDAVVDRVDGLHEVLVDSEKDSLDVVVRRHRRRDGSVSAARCTSSCLPLGPLGGELGHELGDDLAAKVLVDEARGGEAGVEACCGGGAVEGVEKEKDGDDNDECRREEKNVAEKRRARATALQSPPLSPPNKLEKIYLLTYRGQTRR